jgi:heme oxygenase (biliverdin-IX-beta and delta-forming)
MTTVDQTPAFIARRLMRAVDRATLATALDGGDSIWPYASLVLVAADFDASPLLLISTLAEHTKNLARDARASLLFDGTQGLDDPLTGARVTVLGELRRDPDPVRLRRFVSRHPSATLYAGFKDFALYRMTLARAHLVAGFGRIHWIDASAVIDLQNNLGWLGGAEPGILDHMNHDHGATIDLCAERLLGLSGTGWQVTGIDREGADLRRGGTVARLDFPVPADDLDAVRQSFVALAQSAGRGAMSQ